MSLKEKYRFQQILPDGTKYGAYVGTAPNTIAKKMAREVYMHQGYKGKKQFDILFTKNRNISEGGDVLYKFRCVVEELKTPIMKQIGNGKPFYINYKISVKNSN